MSKMYQYHVNNVSILRGYCINTSFIIIMHSQLGLEFGNIVVTMTVAVMGWKGRNLFVANNKHNVDANPKSNRKGKRGDSRSDHKVKVALLKPIGRDKFAVTIFNEGHNHPMTSAVQLFRSHRRISKVKNVMIEQCA